MLLFGHMSVHLITTAYHHLLWWASTCNRLWQVISAHLLLRLYSWIMWVIRRCTWIPHFRNIVNKLAIIVMLLGLFRRSRIKIGAVQIHLLLVRGASLLVSCTACIRLVLHRWQLGWHRLISILDFFQIFQIIKICHELLLFILNRILLFLVFLDLLWRPYLPTLRCILCHVSILSWQL